MILRLFFLLVLVLCSKESEVFDMETIQSLQSANNTFEENEDKSSLLAVTYSPLLLFLQSLSSNETEKLRELLNDKKYAELKNEIDRKRKEADILILSEYLLDSNRTDEMMKHMDIIDGYHNASIYKAIRCLWNLNTANVIPLIDQTAILEYFEEKLEADLSNESIWSKFWDKFHNWVTKSKKTQECYAQDPAAIRKVLEGMHMETRAQIEEFMELEEDVLLEEIIQRQLDNMDNSTRIEFEKWSEDIIPPKPLILITKNMDDVEKEALKRLRAHNLIDSLKDFYRAVIEVRSKEEQEEIRSFIIRMNDTFAGCFQPIRISHDDYENILS